MARQLQAEQEHQKRAFDLYYAQGEKRSCVRLASEMDISVATAKLWARSFGWRQRIAERNASVARQVADDAISSAQQTQSRNRKLIELATSKLAKAMLNGQIKYQLADLDRLIRLQSFLDAEAGRDVLSIDEQLDAFMAAWAALPDAERRTVIDRLRTRAEQKRGYALCPPPPRALPQPPTGAVATTVEPSESG